MAKFNKATAAVAPQVATGPVATATVATGSTYEGAPGFARDAKSELFLLAVANFVGEDTFYEKASDRDTRFVKLVREVAVSDPEWMMRFLPWLRTEANMRSAPIMAALEAADAMVKANIRGSRLMVISVLKRADEPAEALAYWLNKFGRKMPKPIKRGIGHAAMQLYTEFNFLKWDSGKSAVRFADVLELCHSYALTPAQGDLYRYIISARHNREENEPTARLTMIRANRALRKLATPSMLLNTKALREAGFTWEDALSSAGTMPTVDGFKRLLWESLIPTMGYMALLRNLRNFSQEGVSSEVKAAVMARLADAEEVAKSKQLPMRFMSAYLATRQWGHDWTPTLEKALNLSLSNVPELPGSTLILVDVSGSMSGTMSDKSGLSRVQAAAIFGSAFALRNQDRATLVAFDDTSKVIPIPRNGSLLALSGQFQARGGTYTAQAVKRHYLGHDRVLIVTDEQAHDGSPGKMIPDNVPMYTWNVAGYKYGSDAGAPNRYVFGGLTDQGFRMIPLLEHGVSQTWPF